MNTPTDPTNNTLTTLLQDLNRGKVSRDANEAFSQLILDVRKHGKKGELMLKINVAPARGGDAAQVTIAAQVTTKAPSSVPYAGIYFTTQDGGVSKNDPDQPELFKPAVLAPAPAPAAVPQPEPATAAATVA